MKTTKTCKQCGQEKLTSEFYKHPATKDRLRAICIVCYKERNKGYYETRKTMEFSPTN